jgi:hypothetical protein
MDENIETKDPIVEFCRFIEAAPLPKRADRAAGGSIPVRALRYCEALVTASAFGWYIYPPMDLLFRWNYDSILWAYEGAKDWMSLGAAQFPHQSTAFDSLARSNCKGYSPPLVLALPEPGVVQVWSGIVARTAPGWSLHIRAPVNATPGGAFRLYEGIVETDRWFGPLFTNIQLTATHQTIRISRDVPLMQVQPLPRLAYDETTLKAVAIKCSLSELNTGDWDDYYRTVVRGSETSETPGRYASSVRRRRRGGCPFHKNDLQVDSMPAG